MCIIPEIRIICSNQNSFDSDYSELGFVRIISRDYSSLIIQHSPNQPFSYFVTDFLSARLVRGDVSIETICLCHAKFWGHWTAVK